MDTFMLMTNFALNMSKSNDLSLPHYRNGPRMLNAAQYQYWRSLQCLQCA